MNPRGAIAVVGATVEDVLADYADELQVAQGRLYLSGMREAPDS